VHEPLRLELLVATYRRNEPGPWWPVRHWLLPTSSGDSGMLTGIPDQGSAPDERAYAIQQDVPMVSALLSSWRQALQVPLTMHLIAGTPYSTPAASRCKRLTCKSAKPARWGSHNNPTS
jgi:hypothetical protein